MKTNRKLGRVLATGVVLLLAGIAVAQEPVDKSLVVNGKTVRGAMIDVQGRTYVDIKMLADAISGTVNQDADRVTLVLPAFVATSAAVGAGPVAVTGTAPGAAGVPLAAGHLSTDFRAATISALSDMRQWQGAIESVVAQGMNVVGSWPQDYRDQAQASVDLAKVRVSTEDDASAMKLLQNEFASLRDWAGAVVTERKNLQAARFVDPNALKNDVTLNKITDCSRFLGGMVSSGIYADSPSCH